MQSTIASSGGARYNPITSVTFATSSGSVENLKVSAFHGFTPYVFQMPATVEWSTPSRGASSRDDQCVTPRLLGGGVNVAARLSKRTLVVSVHGDETLPHMMSLGTSRVLTTRPRI